MQCPDEETLTAYVLGEASSQAAEIASHVDTCESCMDFVGAVVDKILKWIRDHPEEEAAPPTLDDQVIDDRWKEFLELHGDKILPTMMSCPSDETLTQFVLGNPDNLDEIEAHVNSCATCSRFVDGIYKEGDAAYQEYLEAEARLGPDTEEEPEPEHQC